MKVRVIDDEEGQLGIMAPREALQLARDRGRDLIEIVPNANPPVCKIMDFGKFKYELSKKEKLQRKHQHIALVKELRFHPNTDIHDFNFKTKHARQFLEDGNKVKAVVVFKGREITYKEQGENVLQRLTVKLEDIAKVDQEVRLEGRHMIMIFAPDKSKKKQDSGKQVEVKKANENKE